MSAAITKLIGFGAGVNEYLIGIVADFAERRTALMDVQDSGMSESTRINTDFVIHEDSHLSIRIGLKWWPITEATTRGLSSNRPRESVLLIEHLHNAEVWRPIR